MALNQYGDITIRHGGVPNTHLQGRQLIHPKFGKPQLNHGAMIHQANLYGVRGYYERRNGHEVYIQSHNVRRPGPANHNHPHLQVPPHAYPHYSTLHYPHQAVAPQPPPQNNNDNDNNVEFDFNNYNDEEWDNLMRELGDD